MKTKLVVRVLDKDSNLLAWTEVQAEARGDGCLWATGKYPAFVEQDGVPEQLSIHWADLNVEARFPFPGKLLQHGNHITLEWADRPILRIGPAASGLPAVTVRGNTVIGMPVGNLGGSQFGVISKVG